jgi:hypothetical protein
VSCLTSFRSFSGTCSHLLPMNRDASGLKSSHALTTVFSKWPSCKYAKYFKMSSERYVTIKNRFYQTGITIDCEKLPIHIERNIKPKQNHKHRKWTIRQQMALWVIFIVILKVIVLEFIYFLLCVF